MGRAAREGVEAALLGDLLGGAHDGAPGHARQRAADADAARAERREVGDREPSGLDMMMFTGLGATAWMTAPISSRRAQAGRIEAVGARPPQRP